MLPLPQHGQRNQPYVDPDVLRALPESAFRCGVVLGVVELVKIDQYSNSNWASWDPDDYHWHLRNPRLLPDPIPLKGQQGLFTPPDAVADAIRRLRGKSIGIRAKRAPRAVSAAARRGSAPLDQQPARWLSR
jgi:hypothetical protein